MTNLPHVAEKGAVAIMKSIIFRDAVGCGKTPLTKSTLAKGTFF